MSERSTKDGDGGTQPDLPRRRLLLNLGLAAMAAYAAPLVFGIGSEAEAQSWSDSGRRRRRRRQPVRRQQRRRRLRKRRARSWSDSNRRRRVR